MSDLKIGDKVAIVGTYLESGEIGIITNIYTSNKGNIKYLVKIGSDTAPYVADDLVKM